MSEQPSAPTTEQSPSPEALAAALHAPVVDLVRSPAALRVATLAARAGLFLFDYEQRVQLELPEAWLPAGRPDLGVTGLPPGWERGLLGESKYLSFRHDTLLGSLHAGHRGKWTAHELCHGLVGFCWRPDGSLLFHALAARLAEALPVALWYFFDEAGLARCERHVAHGEVGPSYCAACERVAGTGVGDLGDWTARGRAFLARELAAVRASIASGRPVFSQHGAIDLMTDGLAYAAAHAPRLRSPELQSGIVHTFGEPSAARGYFDDLEAFAAHIEKLGAYVAGDAEAPAGLGGGRWRFIAQDLAGRFMQIAADTDGECFAGLSEIVSQLGDGGAQPDGASGEGDEAKVVRAIEAYEALFDAFELPPSEEVFAVGYALPGGHGVGVAQLREGLESALGATLGRLEARVDELIRAFATRGVFSREPLPKRFAAFLQGLALDAETRGLAVLEAAIACVPPPDPIELGLGLDGALAETLSLPSGVALVRAGFDAGGLLMHGAADPKGPRSFLVRRDAGDEVGLVALSEGLAARLEAGPLDAASVVEEAERDAELRALLEEQLLVPDRWDLSTM